MLGSRGISGQLIRPYQYYSTSRGSFDDDYAECRRYRPDSEPLLELHKRASSTVMDKIVVEKFMDL